jgi:hypothetical protein
MRRTLRRDAADKRFTRQVVLQSVSGALIQSLRLFRAVKITVEIGGLVQHLDIAAGRRTPIDEGLLRG